MGKGRGNAQKDGEEMVKKRNTEALGLRAKQYRQKIIRDKRRKEKAKLEMEVIKNGVKNYNSWFEVDTEIERMLNEGGNQKESTHKASA